MTDPTPKQPLDRTEGLEAGMALPASLARVLDWLRTHLDGPVDLDTLAAIAGVRPRTLEQHFKQLLGTTPLGWVRSARLARAPGNYSMPTRRRRSRTLRSPVASTSSEGSPPNTAEPLENGRRRPSGGRGYRSPAGSTSSMTRRYV
jgi:hypothetical protein